MKKITATIFALALAVCLLPTSAFAVGALPQPDSFGYGLPQPDGYYDSSVGWSDNDGSMKEDYTFSSSVPTPSISAQPTDYSGALGGLPGVLSVGVSGAAASALRYQWYAVDVAGLGAYTAIPGATDAVYTPAQTPGTTYYCVGVYSVAGTLRSDEVMSAVAAVSYSGIELVSLPSKTAYTVGESISLKGLTVRVYEPDGSCWDSRNGNGLSLYPAKAEVAGQAVVELGYGVSTASFNITVAAAKGTDKNGTDADAATGKTDADGEHVHEYDDWVVTKEANCVTTGLRSHSCTVCGDSQTEAIPKTDHTWDEGVITKQPTETSNGSRLYTCTVCKANKSEIIAAGTDTSGQQAGLTVASATPTPAGTVGGGNEVAGMVNTNAGNTGTVNKNADSSGWWLIPVSALVLVGCGSGAYYLMKRKGSE